jgi:hypothetical protein
MARSIPVTILGGSDRKPGSLPESAAGLHPLATYKGVALQVEGRPLVSLLVERLAATRGFGPITIAGPERVYAPLGLAARIVDTDGSVAANLRAAVEAHGVDSGPLGVMACDVLPTAAELLELQRLFEASVPCALCFPFVRVPEDPRALGAFAWKPKYGVVPEGSREAVRILPGHLGVFDPGELRLPLLYRLFGSAYRTRNRPVAYKRAVMLRTVLFSLLAQDVKLLLGLRLPDRTLTVASSGLRLANAVRRGPIRLAELERLIGKIFLRAHVLKERGERAIRFPIVDLVSLAEDIDTEEEARELVHEIEPAPRRTQEPRP